MKGLQFNTDDKQLLVEALLFTANCDVCSDHTEVHRLKMLELAEKINDKNVKLYNIFMYETGMNDIYTNEKLSQKFPNIPLQTIVED